jgi:DNA-binding cell septation regulator SpoVG
VIQGKEKEFVAMPSHMVKQNGKDGKPQYQDVCFPVTKEFREKLYQAITECYKQEKEKAVTQGREQAAAQSMARAESRQPERDLPFR